MNIILMSIELLIVHNSLSEHLHFPVSFVFSVYFVFGVFYEEFAGGVQNGFNLLASHYQISVS